MSNQNETNSKEKNFELLKNKIIEEYRTNTESRARIRRQVLDGELLPENYETKPVGKSFEIYAWGGTRYSERAYFGDLPRIPDEDLYGLEYKKGNIIWGIGEIHGRKFIVIRERQTEEDRGGYAYTLLLDPGDELWEKSGWNGASIINNVLEDPILRDIVMKYPQFIADENIRNNLKSWLEQNNWHINPSSLPVVERALEEGTTSKREVVLTPNEIERPTPENLAEIIATLPKEVRKKLTFIIGAKSGSIYGSKTVWDPGFPQP